MKRICVVGAGGWGTALSILLADKGINVSLWARRKELAELIAAKRENKTYLPSITLPRSINVSSSLEKCLGGSDVIITAVPSVFLRQVLKNIKPYFSGQVVISATKGLEASGCKRMSQVIEEELGVNTAVAVLSGPNHAEEVARKIPTATVVASKSKQAAELAASCLGAGDFKIHTSDDVVGVEFAGALKNITAIAVGICDGIGLGDNTKAGIITLGLKEMVVVGGCFGARRDTFYGLAGVGDLIATCSSKYSRNRLLGECLAKGVGMQDTKKRMKGQVVEGVFTTKAVCECELGVSVPFTTQMYGVLFKEKSVEKAIVEMLKGM